MGISGCVQIDEGSAERRSLSLRTGRRKPSLMGGVGDIAKR